MEDKLKAAGKILFRYRSYTPLPFIIIMLVYTNLNLFSLIIGLFPVILGELLRLWAVGYAGSETRTTSGVGATYLVTQGPYRLMRNPLYLGNILIYSGLGIISYSLFPYLQLIAIVYFSFQYYCIILTEEEHLEKKFGNLYVQYKTDVKRFLISFRTLPDEINSNLEFSWKDGLTSEKRTMQAISVLLLMIFAVYLIKLYI